MSEYEQFCCGLDVHNDLNSRQKAEVLMEMLPWLQEFAGRRVVIKYGGNAMINDELKKCFAQAAMERMGCTPEQTVMVGDQIFTDTWGAHNSGVTPLLVKPIRMAGNPGRYLRYAGETPFRLIGAGRPFV